MSYFECIFCCESENRDFRKITKKCTHHAVICAECVNEYIKGQIDSKNILEFKCPMNDCNEIMKRHDVKNFTTNDIFKEYDELTYNIVIQRDPDFRWCKARCGVGQIHTGKDISPIIICYNCGVKSCYTHDVTWHEDQTCEEYDENMKKPDEYLSQNTKKCPKCSLSIEKNEGCDHMTCDNCRYEFCWSCLREYPCRLSH
ncbi:unnamed protein product [Rhizophagus irregularis]|uniref:RBR-type E3 ubiquitin transferase n=1 Tax=Rhizophagus irregularis TaxID=588596 RepID=A0A2I1G1Y8_9GLOM|nr:hypothetical protein RhiirA4_353059 [Rhizophagus irregularis]CAB4446348.1 unnamed protein product [Rhizophagus irregularis]CAB4446389.1 unnamed protein product [Rhizophagus irregularis]